MDRISELPNALLLKILSFVPTKDVMATSVLSKRWQSLWKIVPKLTYNSIEHNSKYGTFAEFVYRSLLLHKAPVLETLNLRLDSSCADVDIGIWIGIAADRCVRELDVIIPYIQRPIRMPRTLYTCETLVVLMIENVTFVDVPLKASIMSLKTLHLLSVKYSGDESVRRLLSSCPFLEDLVIERCPDDNVRTFTVKSATLRRLSIGNTPDIDDEEDDEEDDLGYVIDTPSLEYLNIEDFRGGFCLLENAPKVVEANVDVLYGQFQNILGSLTSVKRLRLCLLTAKDPYPTGSIFSELVHVEICTCGKSWWDILARILEDSPKLRVLKLSRSQYHLDLPIGPYVQWKLPSPVPECLLFHLETFEWKTYGGSQVENDIATYIIMNASRLNVAAISLQSTNSKKQVRIIKDLASVPRASSTCRLLFD